MMKNTIIYVIAVIAATGGLLFGFDTGVISGAIPFFQKDFGLDNSMVELVTSAGLVGAILGALFCGKITDILGRKVVILASAVIFTIGALWSGFAPSIEQLIIARLFLGIAIGVSSFAVPLYIAEISPANKRGSLVSMFQLMITIGVLASYLSDLMFADEGDMSCWRPMFYIGVVPALILLIGMAFMRLCSGTNTFPGFWALNEWLPKVSVQHRYNYRFQCLHWLNLRVRRVCLPH